MESRKSPRKTLSREVRPEGSEQHKLSKRVSINSENFVMCRVGSFDDHYIVTGKIGQGSFGTVYRVKHKTLKLQRALKTIKKRMNGTFSSFQEIEVLKKLDHANILKIYEFYEAADNYYIITEIFEGKQLFDLILEQQKITERDAAEILKQVLRALNYTHSQGIAHRDVKPENILVKKLKNQYRVKIIDWGLGTLIGEDRASRICGTPEYCAPEVLKGSYTISCDMWSVGAIAFVMLTGEMPFTGNNTEETIDIVKKGNLNTSLDSFKKLSASARRFITSLMNKNPAKRLTASQALNHQWLQANTKNETQPFFLKQTLQRLKQIKLTSRFSTAVLSFMSNHLGQQQQRQKLQEIFKHLDINNDGVLSLNELVEGYTKIYGKQVGRQIASQTFSKLDLNNNNSLEFSEFVTFGLKQQKQQQQNRLRQAFNLFDRDKNGKISREQIGMVLRGKIDRQVEAELKEMIQEIDQDGDNQIDVDQFIQCIEKVHSEAKNVEVIDGGVEKKALKTKTITKKKQIPADTKVTKPKIAQIISTQNPPRLLRSNSKGKI